MTNRASLREKEMNLFQAYQGGDDKAKYELLNSLGPVVQGQVNKYRGSGLPDVALKLEARRLASKAIDTYDPNRGFERPTGTYRDKI